MDKRRLNLYMHIPFCVQKCAYCDFLSFPADSTTQRRYVEALCREIRTVARTDAGKDQELSPLRAKEHPDPDRTFRVQSLFFGGGTPSVLPAEWIAEILSEIRNGFAVADDAEITIEANPGTVDLEKLQCYRAAGIDRISFGAQSFHDRELRMLGRIHTCEEIVRSMEMAREAGFTNCNLDLMYGLPGQTLSSWEETLRHAIALSPEHISAYSLILEEGTPFYARYAGQDPATCDPLSSVKQERPTAEERAEAQREEQQLPGEETERKMDFLAETILSEAGYHRYEISNYAKTGHVCRHNIGYWTGVPYRGFGLGAASYLPAAWLADDPVFAGDATVSGSGNGNEERNALWQRWNNTRDITRYLAGNAGREEVQQLEETDRMAEFLILGLRMTEGVEDAGFARRFGRSLDDVYGEVLQKYTASGHLCREEGRTFFSPQGVAVSNAILVDFLP